MQGSPDNKKITLRTMDANRPDTCVKLDHFSTVDELEKHLNFNNQPEDGYYSIRNADLSGLKLNAGLRMRRLHLENVKLHNAELQDVMISLVNFTGVDFTGANLSTAMFTGGTLDECIFDKAQMGGATLMRLQVTESSFTGADMNSGELESSKFYDTTFAGANMNGCDLRRTTWQGCDLRGAKTEGLEDFNEFTVIDTQYDDAFARQMTGISSYNQRVSPQRMRQLRPRKPGP